MKETIKTHIKENIKEYLFLIFTLLIGACIGIFIINNTSDLGKTEITEYINSFCQNMQNGNIQYVELLKILFKQNVCLLIAMFIISLTFFTKIGVICIIGYKGLEMRLYNIKLNINMWNTEWNIILNMLNHIM